MLCGIYSQHTVIQCHAKIKVCLKFRRYLSLNQAKDNLIFMLSFLKILVIEKEFYNEK